MAQLADGSTRRVADLVKGDMVLASCVGETAIFAEVLCVVRTMCPDSRAVLVELPGGARLTPHHPVQVDGVWRFPKDLAGTEERPCESVFSFILQDAPSILVGGVPCVALGHGIEEGAAAHPYFGSERVIEDIAKLDGYESGFVELPAGCAVRDPATGLVCGLRLKKTKQGGA